MNLDPGEVQILNGPDLTVTDRRIVAKGETILVANISAPQIDNAVTTVSMRPFLIGLAIIFVALGLLFVGPMLWISGAIIGAFGVFAQVKRPALTVSADVEGARRAIYTTAIEKDANLALAALQEALKRRAA